MPGLSSLGEFFLLALGRSGFFWRQDDEAVFPQLISKFVQTLTSIAGVGACQAFCSAQLRFAHGSQLTQDDMFVNM